MKIGTLVRQNIGQIFENCNNVEHDELNSLLNLTYSKIHFGLNYPFCILLENINENSNKTQSRRYYQDVYSVSGKRVRVTSQWIEGSRSPFMLYLESKGITAVPESFGSLETESLGEEVYNSTKDYFSHKCSYCGAETELRIEHSIRIKKVKT